MKNIFCFIFILVISEKLISNEKKTKAKDISSSIKIKKISRKKFSYEYKATHKKNPFLPPVIEDLKPKMEIPIVNVLQRYQISQLKLVGTWNLENKEKNCLLLTPESKGLIGKIGDYIGRKGGRISQITENSIEITYYKLLDNGDKEKLISYLYLSEDSKPTKKGDSSIIIRSNETNEANEAK